MTVRPNDARPAPNLAFLAGVALALAACATSAPKPPLRLVPGVDMSRYMGDWYVDGVIPTFIEKDASNAVEHYELTADGTIDMTYSYSKSGATGKRILCAEGLRTLRQWSQGVQFISPFEADYRIVQIDETYDTVVVGREKRDNVWIMSRRPSMADADYQKLVALVAGQGYDTSKLVRVPQHK